ncbi:hypothetical protein BaRGS_00025573 [Batillaria attramentaria]|uniref:Uncharacterized protein n=1 Tax=Batillaria attramentaria TaxID=370345 RepID=A0ABD0K7X2_9CAEN
MHRQTEPESVLCWFTEMAVKNRVNGRVYPLSCTENIRRHSRADKFHETGQNKWSGHTRSNIKAFQLQLTSHFRVGGAVQAWLHYGTADRPRAPTDH